MKRCIIRIALILCLAVGMMTGLGGKVLAETPQERMEAALRAEGYVIVQSERTWLGRLRIIAMKGDLRREVVLNPGTGEVLRDIALVLEHNESSGDGGNAVASSVGSGGTGSGLAPGGGTSITSAGNAAVDSSSQTQPGLGTASDGSMGVTRDLLLPEAGVTQ